MIVGVYKDHFPCVRLMVQGTAADSEIDFIMDTAFEGSICLPPNLIVRLGGELGAAQIRTLADGSITRCAVYRLLIDWDGTLRPVEVLALENRPLLGTAVLEGHHLDIEATENGEVLIEPL